MHGMSFNDTFSYATFKKAVSQTQVENKRIHVNGKTFRYTGQVKDGKPHGRGTARYDNHSKYVGEFRNGKRHGQGSLVTQKGNKYKGEWKNNEITRSHDGAGLYI